ncbi:MAG: trypsin-like peptidase domain-containing protein [Armatimonadota bacterium]|nr:MAG: trypsin-like peptidase domain-containing protein [Armatimonadota bacterium]
MEGRKYRLTISVAWVIALVVVFGAVLGISYRYHGLVGMGMGNASAATLEPPPQLESLQNAFQTLAEHAKPSVVNISSEQDVKVSPRDSREQDELRERLRRLFGDEFDFPSPMPMPPTQPRRSLGSGVIIDAQGCILTSAHVVRDADRVTVTLADGKELRAEILASDPQTDLAVIKIDSAEAKAPLVPAALGNADNEKVGSWVMAVGSPLGLEETMTVGVISAKNRTFRNPNVQGKPFREMIQTDAVINPGNSGGPLLNIRGEVIAINTLIVSTTGFNIGLGFAIPINPANRSVIESLKVGETPTRGQLGVYIRPVDEAIAKEYGVEAGAYVNEVMPDSPAAKAGIQAEDIIVQYGKKQVDNEQDLVQAVEATKPGAEVDVTVVRNRERKTIQVAIGQVSAAKEVTAAATTTGKLGVTVSEITPQLTEQYSLKADHGVVVTKLDPNGEGTRAGIQEGDVIVKINRVGVASVADYETAVDQLKPGDAVVIRATRGERIVTLTIRSLGQ